VAYGGNEHLILAVRERSLLAALDYDYSFLQVLSPAMGLEPEPMTHHEPLSVVRIRSNARQRSLRAGLFRMPFLFVASKLVQSVALRSTRSALTCHSRAAAASS